MISRKYDDPAAMIDLLFQGVNKNLKLIDNT